MTVRRENIAIRVGQNLFWQVELRKEKWKFSISIIQLSILFIYFAKCPVSLSHWLHCQYPPLQIKAEKVRQLQGRVMEREAVDKTEGNSMDTPQTNGRVMEGMNGSTISADEPEKKSNHRGWKVMPFIIGKYNLISRCIFISGFSMKTNLCFCRKWNLWETWSHRNPSQPPHLPNYCLQPQHHYCYKHR